MCCFMTRHGIISCMYAHPVLYNYTRHHIDLLFSSQVTEQTGAILRDAGFELEERGKVFVKGKGEMTTFYVVGTDKGRIQKE